jgi:polysaccharide export outer membrane protein
MLRQLLGALLVVWSGAAIAPAQESLLIASGDQLHVRVFDTPEMDQHPRVTDAGNIPLLFVGDVKVGGMTPGDAARTIEAALIDKQYMLHPHVAVTVDEYGTQQISVMGQVKSPGAYDVTAPEPILSVLSLAGGLTELADRHITIQRHGNPNERVSYFFSNSSDKAFDSNVLVNPGDTVLVPRAGIVYIIGDVAHPGGYAISTNDGKLGTLQAIAMAGYTNKTAISDGARLVRKTDAGVKEMPLHLASIEKGKSDDVLLQADDIVLFHLAG